jgi:crotonobetainyl-CoA:carnitine CoA-transferase CaiB-like acyl-CoA transferase
LAAGNTVVIKPAESASLAVVRVVELLQSVFPPGMMLVDLGAEVILVERASDNPNSAGVGKNSASEFYKRGKKSISLDLKQQQSIDTVLQLVEQSDALIEGFRPGVMERLGLGPELCLARNPRLVYGRMTGWGQDGPLSHAAGHDINYLSISGVLPYGGTAGEAPYPPPTVLGDIGSGSNMLVIGILSAMLSAQRTGSGQVIDAAICDGAIYNQTLLAAVRADGLIGEKLEETFFRAGSHWCNTYQCADGRYITVQALEPDFYRELVERCGFSDDEDFRRQHDKSTWPAARDKMRRLFESQSQEYWSQLLEGTDACFAPVLNLPEAADHPHNMARKNFVEDSAYLQPAPAPKFSVTTQEVGTIPVVGEHTEEILQRLSQHR